MKKLLLIMMVFVMMLSICACDGIENDTATTDTVSTQTLTEQATKEPTTKPTEAPIEKSTEPPTESPKWKQAYIDKVYSLYNESEGFINKFNLVYINDDALPELYAWSGTRTPSDELCWYNSDRVESIYVGEMELEYIPLSGYFLQQGGGGPSVSGDNVYYFDGTACEELFDGVVYYNEGCTYRIDDEDVSESFYFEKLNSAYDLNKSVSAADAIYSQSEIISVIINW